ncbi:pantetheine-phosphate adenylyltransferase [Aureimonas sp. ME7]|uniref:pantetheine-phosphate adenylyltransferase n=1 Tax=Aureimonas sp. ME7 TaxID=2744252 RepID=UPI0015F6032A|nr:pantetheine-phosphate adenylyltransferase [Aureimonas sp. ME7]
MRIGLYAGSFDPLTLGHLHVIERASELVDKLVVSVGIHPGKTTLFSAHERSLLIETVLDGRKSKEAAIEVSFFSDLVVQEADRHGAQTLFRGIRDGTDLDYEMQMSAMNAGLAPHLSTVFIPASLTTRPITATLVRQIARMGGDVSKFVPEPVAAAFKRKLSPI